MVYILFVILAILLADLIAGIFHWWEDRNGNDCFISFFLFIQMTQQNNYHPHIRSHILHIQIHAFRSYQQTFSFRLRYSY